MCKDEFLEGVWEGIEGIYPQSKKVYMNNICGCSYCQQRNRRDVCRGP